jgi:hypothetical protein
MKKNNHPHPHLGYAKDDKMGSIEMLFITVFLAPAGAYTLYAYYSELLVMLTTLHHLLGGA